MIGADFEKPPLLMSAFKKNQQKVPGGDQNLRIEQVRKLKSI
jgi:hypothetical protein